jgi:hypothetical protein
MAISKGGWWAAQQPASSTPSSTTTETPSADSTSGAAAGGIHRKSVPAGVWDATGSRDAFGGFMSPYGQYTYPSSEAMRAAMRSPGVIQKMQSGEYGSQWQELTSDPVSLYGLFTGETQHVDDDPVFGEDFRQLGQLDFTGFTSMALGDPEPRGVLGLYADVADHSFGIDESDFLGVTRAAMGMLHPGVAAGLQVAPALAHGASFDPEEMLKRAALSAGIGYAADFAAPYVSAAFDDLPAGEMVADAAEATGEGVPMYSTPAETNVFGSASTPAMTTYSGPSGSAIGGTVAPAAMGAGMLSLADDPLAAEDIANRDALEAGDYPEPQPEPTVTSADLQRYVKIGRAVNDLLGGDAGGPVQDEGESQEQFTGELADYLGLDAETMAAEGLQPGSPEYMEYIMARADAVIGAVLGDMDVDSADLAAQLRGKTEAELLQLQRALFVRGQMDQLMRSGTYADPFGGASQEVIGEGMFNPAVGAYQRGVAGDVEQLAGLYGPDALSFLSERLGRTGDPFGMQAAADARMRQAELEPKDDELRRRRGMFAPSQSDVRRIDNWLIDKEGREAAEMQQELYDLGDWDERGNWTRR